VSISWFLTCRRNSSRAGTFITLAQEDGARRDVLKVITHAPDAADVMSLYTTYPWPTLCAELAKLDITLPGPRVAPTADAGSETLAEPAQPTAPA
jgi:hypothetical protein